MKWKGIYQTCALALVFLILGCGVYFFRQEFGEAGMLHHINMLVLPLGVILVAAWMGGRLFYFFQPVWKLIWKCF